MITGRSLLKMAETQSLPMPGQAKMFSITKVPATSFGIDMPSAVTVPLRLLSIM